MLRGAVLGLTLALAAGCGTGTKTGTITHELPTAAACAGDPAIVVAVTTPGDEPRVERRYTYTQGASAVMVTTASGTMQYKIGEEILQNMAVPQFELAATATVDAVDADGSATIGLDVDRGAWDPDFVAHNTDPEEVVATVANIADARASLAIDACGRIRSVVWAVPTAAGIQVQTRIEQAALTFTRMRPALPAEPIGVGATWTVTAPIVEGGMKSTEVLTYTLVAIAPTGALTVAIKLVDDAAAQVLPQNAMMTGPQDILSSHTEGDGEVVIEPAAVVPVRGAIANRNALQVRARDTAGKTYEVQGKATLDLALERR